MHLCYTNTDIGQLALGCVTWGGLPVKTELTESGMRLESCTSPKAIVLYLARLAGLLPTHPDDALPIESMLLDIWEERSFNLHAWRNMGAYVVSERPTVIDLALYVIITRKGMQKALGLYPDLQAWYGRMHARLA